MTPSDAPLALAFFAATLALQGVILWVLRPQRLIGDEKDYVQDHVQTHVLWVRAPLHRMIMRMADRLLAGPGHIGARGLNCLISAICVGLAVGYVERVAGGTAACVTGVVLLLSLERTILAIHLWPDTTMGLIVMTVALLSVHPTPLFQILAACVATVGFAIRIEGAFLVMLASIVPLITGQFSGLYVLLPCLVCGAGVAVLCLYARHRFGTWCPDTTFRFNLAVARTELTLDDPSTAEVMKITSRHVKEGTVPDIRIGPSLRKILAMVAVRIRVMLATDKFISQSLLWNNAPLYRATGWIRPPRVGAALLCYGFTGVALIFAAALPLMPPDLLGVFFLMAGVYVSVQTRGRYRMSLLPLMAVLLGLSVPGLEGQDISTAKITVSALAVAVAGILLYLVPERMELRVATTTWARPGE